MDKNEEKMRDLLYDFKRYFEQLKEDGAEWVAAAQLPPPRDTKVASSPKPESARAPARPEKTIQARKPAPAAPVGKAAPVIHKPEPSSPAGKFGRLIETINGCRKCGLASTRKFAVPGEGGNDLRILFVGEGPGAEENRTGRPFVGRSGQLLDKILASISLSRKDIFITNIVKCRPPGNRDPHSEEVIACWPYLEEQIALLKPRVIVTLGSPAAKTLLDTNTGIGRLRGRFHDYHGIPLLPTYHPAYLLRSYTVENRKKVWEDMKMVREVIKD